MLPFSLVHHEGYDLDLGRHVFPARKYRLIRWRLIEESFAHDEDFLEPTPASDAELLLVHSADWVRKLKTGTLTSQDITRLEIPCSPKTVEAFCLATGGTILAGRLALQHGIGFNVGGGFQHGFRGHGEGFCAINDVAVAVRTLQREGSISNAMVVDCDVHQGNGTAAIFAGDDSVFTLSVHQFDNYPFKKPPSDIDVHLPDGTDDVEYCARLEAALLSAFTQLHPDLLVYVAGADPYYQDQLGGLTLTFDGLWRRDLLVIETALRHGSAVAVTLGGGYAVHLLNTVTIHTNTAKVAKQVLEEVGWRPSSA
jgi:acetoin utilization deacetylase AcuC-like enzyme